MASGDNQEFGLIVRISIGHRVARILNYCVLPLIGHFLLLTTVRAVPPDHQQIASLSDKLASAPKAPAQSEIERAIKRLGDNEFEIRRRASRFLWTVGKPAELQLLKALSDRDAEIALRASVLLEKIRYGIRPDTPPEVVRMVYQYRNGDRDRKRSALSELQRLEQFAMLISLVRSEKDADLQNAFARVYLTDAERIVRRLLAKGTSHQAESLLFAGAISGRGMRNAAVYLELQGTIDYEIEQQRRVLAILKSDKKPTREYLIWLLRIKGDEPAVREMIGHISNEYVRRDLWMSWGSWLKAAATYDEIVSGENEGTNQTSAKDLDLWALVQLRRALAYHARAGNLEYSTRITDQLKKRAPQRDILGRLCAEALLIGAQFDDAIEVYKKCDRTAAFKLLVAQLRYQEAFELLGIGEIDTVDTKWFDSLSGTANPMIGEDLGSTFQITLIARAASDIGKKKQAIGLLQRLLQRESKSVNRTLVAETAVDLGLQKEVFPNGILLVQDIDSKDVLKKLHPARKNHVDLWWNYFQVQDKKSSDSAIALRVNDLLARLDDLSMSVAEIETLCAKLAALPRSGDITVRIERLLTAGELLWKRGHRDKGLAYFVRAGKIDDADDPEGSLKTMLRLADAYRELKQGREAAQWYGKTWQRSIAGDAKMARPIALYMQGNTLADAGQKSNGDRLKQLALVYPLADAPMRHALANDLKKNGFADEAERQFRLIVRAAPNYDDSDAVRAAQQLGNLLANKNGREAGDYWDRMILSCLKSGTAFSQIEGYLTLQHLVHKAKARDLIKQKQFRQAARHWELARRAQPGETRLPIALVPELDRCGQKEFADKLFEEVFQANEALVHAYPEAAKIHNRLAWLVVRTNRRLEDGLKHAQRATQLRPFNADYWDTLAELHFRRADRPEAIKAVRRCIDLEPKNPHFRKQLARFESSD